jgi:hypothetical protein
LEREKTGQEETPPSEQRDVEMTEERQDPALEIEPQKQAELLSGFDKRASSDPAPKQDK